MSTQTAGERTAEQIIAGRLTVPVWPDAAELCGIGKTAAYEAVHRGDIPSLRIGGRILVPVRPLLKLLGADVLG